MALHIARERLHQVPDVALPALLSVVVDSLPLPGPPGTLRFYGPTTRRYLSFIEGESAPTEPEVLGVTQTHSFRLSVGTGAGELAVRAASVLQDDVMDELVAPWPEVTGPGLDRTVVLQPAVDDKGDGRWEGSGLTCAIGELHQTFGAFLKHS